MTDIIAILRDNWMLLLVGQYPNGPLGGIADARTELRPEAEQMASALAAAPGPPPNYGGTRARMTLEVSWRRAPGAMAARDEPGVILELTDGRILGAAVEPRIGSEQRGADEEEMQQRLPQKLRQLCHLLPMRVGPPRTFMAISMIIFFKIASAKVSKSLATIMKAPGPPITFSL